MLLGKAVDATNTNVVPGEATGTVSSREDPDGGNQRATAEATSAVIVGGEHSGLVGELVGTGRLTIYDP